MTLPNNLFIDTPEVEDISMTQLSSDSSEWAEDIITKLKERIPNSANASLSVKFMKQDDEIGAATGSITVATQDKTAVIPVIIRDFMLYPLDVFMYASRVLPLTPENFAEAFFSGSEQPLDSLSEYPLIGRTGYYVGQDSLQNTIYPPNWGRYAFASAQYPEHTDKNYPLLDVVAKNIDGKEFWKKASADERVVAGFYNTGHLPVLKKLANTQPVNMQEYRQGVDKLTHRPINVLFKEGPNRYNLLSSSAKSFNPAMATLDRLEVQHFLSKACDKVDSYLHDVDQNGEKVIFLEDTTGGSPILGRPEMPEVEEADNFGVYRVRDSKTGVTHEGLVVPKVIDFDQNPQNTKLFLGKTSSTMQGDIFGVPMRDADWMPEGEAPKVGQTGTFLYHKDGKNGLATVPVTIVSVMTDLNKEQMRISATDLHGMEFKIVFTTGKCGCQLQRIAHLKNPHGEDIYMVPGFFSWVPMEGFIEVSSSKFEYHVKVAGEKTDAHGIKVISKGYSQYAVRGLDKYAQAMERDPGHLQRHETMFLLANCGLDEEKIAAALERADKFGQVDVGFIRRPQLWSEKVAANYPRARELAKTASDLRCDFLKVASYVESTQTVDALLSLNFVTAENIANFVSKIPQFKSAQSHLASCLLASRLGIKEIPEESTATAIAKLGDVIEGLEALRASQSMGKK